MAESSVADSWKHIFFGRFYVVFFLRSKFVWQRIFFLIDKQLSFFLSQENTGQIFTRNWTCCPKWSFFFSFFFLKSDVTKVVNYSTFLFLQKVKRTKIIMRLFYRLFGKWKVVISTGKINLYFDNSSK